MEASLANVVEPGDVVLIGVNGYFGERLVDMAGRYGAEVQRLDKAWGEVFDLDELRAGVEKHRPAVLALVHAETSRERGSHWKASAICAANSTASCW
jgi:alanine-glyoxylate transaminase/serine-glyoxylate transaminase/serine-pyruvate transaminase